jgi:hypothetical protein
MPGLEVVPWAKPSPGRTWGFCRGSAGAARIEADGPGSARTTNSPLPLLSRTNAAHDGCSWTCLDERRLPENRKIRWFHPIPTYCPGAGRLRWASIRAASVPQRSTRAPAVTNGRQRFRGTVGHRHSSSRSWDDASRRFGLWSRRAGVRVPSVTPRAVRVAPIAMQHRSRSGSPRSSRTQVRALDKASRRRHVAGSGPSTLTTVALTPPTQTTTPSPLSAVTDSRWMRCAGM